MRRAGLEWIHRAMSEPRRLARRYARDAFIFLPRLARQAWRGRRSVRVGQLDVRDRADGGRTLDLSRLDRADNIAAAEISAAIRQAARSDHPLDVIGGARQDAFEHIEGLVPLLARVTRVVGRPEH
jgi:hypothetical protein